MAGGNTTKQGRGHVRGILRAWIANLTCSTVGHSSTQVHELWVPGGGLPVVLQPQGGLDSAQFC